MENKIYNIDSKFRNIISYPQSSNYVYNTMDTGTRIEPFNEKNVIEMKILSIEIPNTIYFITSSRGNNTLSINNIPLVVPVPDGSYTKQELVDWLNTNVPDSTFSYNSATGKVTITNGGGATGAITFPVNTTNTNYLSLGQILGFLSTDSIAIGATLTATNNMIIPQESYFFLQINGFGNIFHRNNRYVAKILNDSQGRFDDINQETIFKTITNTIKFDQPLDIPQLKITLVDRFGEIVDLNGNDFSFTLELTIITNTILKNYDEIRFYNDNVMEKILRSKMLAYYEKQVDKQVNDTLTSTYNNNLVNLNTHQEYNPFGSRNNYAPNFSYFTDMDKRS